jgi:CubicO group peptidase (beta-lactamase class C family)
MKQRSRLFPQLACALLAVVAVRGLAAGAEADLSRRVDQMVHRPVKPNGPGFAVLVVRGGTVVHSRGYGLANIKDKTPITAQTAFDLASVSKQFTALAVLILHERGKLSLEDDVRKHRPELPARSQGRQVTVRDLLQHTSGLPDYSDLVDETRATNEDVLEAVVRHKRVRPAGNRHRYCNTGYVLAALVVERVSGKKLPAFLKQEVFGPLRMEHTTVCAGPARTPERARGYVRGAGGKLHPEPGLSPIYGDGSIFTTLEDMARWDAGLLAARLVKAETLRLAWKPGRLNNGKRFGYGLGWEMEPGQEKLVVWHSGGFATYICRHVDDDLTVVVLSNCSASDSEALDDRIAELYLARDK